MDLFPDGGLVRLRNRARGLFVFADKDASGVSLRPLGFVEPSLSTVWRVKILHVEGANVLLLQGAAYGRYLAVANEGERAPSGHLGVRAVQRDLNSASVDDPFVRRVVRAEAGQNYVRLRNYQRYLRANGKHGLHGRWNNLVTVDVKGGSDNTMMQWRVEAVPSTMELLPLPPPPPSPCKEGCCCACGREGSAALCRHCAQVMKAKLLAVARDRIDAECAQKHGYCLECQDIFTDTHTEHQERSIPLGRYKNECVAWATGDEDWKTIFRAIESKDRGIKPYQLYTSKDPRCIVAKLGGELETDVEKTILGLDFSDDPPVGFCFTCATAVIRHGGKAHRGHDWIRMRTEPGGLRPRVVIPDGHSKEKDWAIIKKEGLANNEVLIRDESSLRCKKCQKRLASEGNSCSLQCSLEAANMEPRFLPRPIELSSLGAAPKIA